MFLLKVDNEVGEAEMKCWPFCICGASVCLLWKPGWWRWHGGSWGTAVWPPPCGRSSGLPTQPWCSAGSELSCSHRELGNTVSILKTTRSDVYTTVFISSHRLARAPLQYFCMVTVAQQILVYLSRASHPLTWLWMITAATHSLSALSLSRRATWPALKNTLVFPKQYWSGSGISFGRASLHRAWAWSWFWGPWIRMRYLLKNSSYVHLKREQIC